MTISFPYLQDLQVIEPVMELHAFVSVYNAVSFKQHSPVKHGKQKRDYNKLARSWSVSYCIVYNKKCFGVNVTDGRFTLINLMVAWLTGLTLDTCFE